MQSSAQFDRDVEGYMVDPGTWNEDLARLLAADEDLELTEAHWQVLCFMHECWRENKVAPDVRHLTRHLVEARDYDNKAAKQHLFQLFPYGYVRQACKIAGMRRPRAWRTG